ncbi:MAG: class I SAM-dependent methyltransferase [Candidatus Pacebacteria bacterium]|nr:class I SAM-dependent methyltransferase [Candidatus Paceibacterota bacterium]NUQ57078.1 class I SAM-dependent methyltransferase [Candidatus Paceibacter sp.]
MASQERFGFEWGKYSSIDPNHEIQFKKWIYPLSEKDFSGKAVLDAGCGMGRNSYWPLKWGAASATAFDFDHRSVESARKNLAGFKNAEVLYKSIYDIDFKDRFDIAFSIGVVHHLADPHKAVLNMVNSVKKGGEVLVWVYGYEGNEWIVKFVSPVRKILTSKLPPFLLNWLTFLVSAPLYLYVKFFPVKHPYLKQLKGFSFRHVHYIALDQLLPKIANYWKKEEAEALLRDKGLENIQIYQSNGNSWTVVGTRA